MYLSTLGFFKRKLSLEQQQLLNYLNLLTTNLKCNLLKIQLAYLQQGLTLLTAAQNSPKPRRFVARFKNAMRKRKAKKRLILRKNHPLKPMGKRNMVKAPVFKPVWVNTERVNEQPKRHLKPY